ncbi:hypothetical protein FA13DRAFT_1807886, partial [Coprinellus micaceus]
MHGISPPRKEPVSREELSLLVLLPFTTAAPVLEVNLEDALPIGDPFRGFAKHLDGYTKGLRSELWGGENAEQLLVGKLHQNLNPLYRNRNGKQKILTSITHRVAEFASAYRFYDVLVRLGGKRVSRNVLKQPGLDVYVGDKPYMDSMISLSNLVNQFTAVADAYEEWLSTQSAVRPQNPEPLHHIASCTSDHLFSIAANLELTSNVKKALKVIRNLSSVAFTARLVMKAACISVPPTYDTLVNILPQDSRPRTKEETQILSAVMKTTRGLRQSFELAALVSPLIAIYPGREIQSQNYAVCSEELLLNCKVLGNCRPCSVQVLEDQVWCEILGIAKGEQTAFEALLKLRDTWKANPPNLTDDDSFFNRASKAYSPDLSVFTTVALEPYPPTWPLRSSTQQFITHSSPTEQATTLSTSSTFRLLGGATAAASSANSNSDLRTGLESESSGALESPAVPAPKGSDTGPKKTSANFGKGNKEPRRSTRERKPPPLNAPSSWTPKKDPKNPRKRTHDGTGPADGPGPNTEASRSRNVG